MGASIACSAARRYQRGECVVAAMVAAMVVAGLAGCASASKPAGAPSASSTPGVSSVSSTPGTGGELPTFAAYAVDSLLEGPPADVDLASHPDGARLAERIEAGAEDSPDFAGRFRVVSWSCGTQCTTGVVIDLRDGSLHTLPTAELDLEYRLESALLIINPRPETLFAVGEAPDWARTRYLYWDGERFHLLGPFFAPAP